MVLLVRLVLVGLLVGSLVRWFVGLLVCWLRSLIEVNPKKFLRNAFLQKKSGFREVLMSQNKGKVEEYWELPCNIAIYIAMLVYTFR